MEREGSQEDLKRRTSSHVEDTLQRPGQRLGDNQEATALHLAKNDAPKLWQQDGGAGHRRQLFILDPK